MECEKSFTASVLKAKLGERKLSTETHGYVSGPTPVRAATVERKKNAGNNFSIIINFKTSFSYQEFEKKYLNFTSRSNWLLASSDL